MNGIIELIIYFVAILGIILTYISLKNSDELCEIDSTSDLGTKKVDVIIKIKNYDEEEIKTLVDIIKYGKFDNLSNVVDNIKIEK